MIVLSMNDIRITAIINGYTRSTIIHEQIKALKEQTIPPTHIIIWQNDRKDCTIQEEIYNDPTIAILHCNKNIGVWSLFASGLMTNTEYIGIFDHDIIPGRKWFENCLTTMKHVNGLLGTIGCRFQRNSQQYRFEKRIGWDGPNYETREVDMVSHAYFFKREWLPELFRVAPHYNILVESNETMGLFYAFQKIGINVFVPPHPPLDYDMYGNNPEKAIQYGCEPISIWTTNTIFDEMVHYKKRGFICINDRT